MSGTLYVVATPIGNLEDITLRALRVLGEVALIAAEDTRRTAKLLAHHGISTPTLSFQQHNTRSRLPRLLRQLESGQSIAIVSDAGTPGISDPGEELVRACIERGIPVDPIPGASAVLAALVASGFPTTPVTFLGFAPTKANARDLWLKAVAAVPHTVVLFEAPHRIAAFLKQASQYLGQRPMIVGRELTKVHQEIAHGTASELGSRRNIARGELTIVIGPAVETLDSADVFPDAPAVASEFRQLTNNGELSRRQAIASLARKYRRPAREVYARLEAAKTR